MSASPIFRSASLQVSTPNGAAARKETARLLPSGRQDLNLRLLRRTGRTRRWAYPSRYPSRDGLRGPPSTGAGGRTGSSPRAEVCARPSASTAAAGCRWPPPRARPSDGQLRRAVAMHRARTPATVLDRADTRRDTAEDCRGPVRVRRHRQPVPAGGQDARSGRRPGEDHIAVVEHQAEPVPEIAHGGATGPQRAQRVPPDHLTQGVVVTAPRGPERRAAQNGREVHVAVEQARRDAAPGMVLDWTAGRVGLDTVPVGLCGSGRRSVCRPRLRDGTRPGSTRRRPGGRAPARVRRPCCGRDRLRRRARRGLAAVPAARRGRRAARRADRP